MSRPGGRLPSGNIGRVCITQQDAEELAERLVPFGNEPIWDHATRSILVAIIKKLQQENGKFWCKTDLQALSRASRDKILHIVLQYLPDAAHYLERKSKRSEAVLINLYIALADDDTQIDTSTYQMPSIKPRAAKRLLLPGRPCMENKP
jgi:hypothetical protein